LARHENIKKFNLENKSRKPETKAQPPGDGDRASVTDK
jgi:hypothetical protein